MGTPEDKLTDADWAAIEAAGAAVVLAAGGRDWAFRAPTKAIYSAYKADANKPEKAPEALASLARACLVPMPGASLDAERAAWDDVCDRYPATPDVVGGEVLALALGPHEVVRRERRGSSGTPSETRK